MNNTIFDNVFRTMIEKMSQLTDSLINEVFKTSYLPDFLEVFVTLPDDSDFPYRIPTVKLENYDTDDMFTKNLQILLPFYILRYERMAQTLADDSEAFHSLTDEYAAIRRRLKREIFQKRIAWLVHRFN